MQAFNDIYRNRRVLITGNTGFKGNWLAMWLNDLGANILGIAKEPFDNDLHFRKLKLDYLTNYIDLGDLKNLLRVINEFKPEIIFHLAAQSLVLESYINPVLTYQTNVIGTLNVFEAARQSESVRAIINVTSDKVYENKEENYAYIESDRLGGVDLYSSSKACSEILTASYRRAFYENKLPIKLVTVRAGNVIGGGDFSKDRLIPDIIKATHQNIGTNIRNPQALRPWQHVLEPLSGYLLLGQKLLENQDSISDSYNFGPKDENCISVGEISTRIKKKWKKVRININNGSKDGFHEAKLLKLDSSKAKKELKWNQVWNLDETLDYTVNWYKYFEQNNKTRTFEDLYAFIESAKAAHLDWSK